VPQLAAPATLDGLRDGHDSAQSSSDRSAAHTSRKEFVESLPQRTRISGLEATLGARRAGPAEATARNKPVTLANGHAPYKSRGGGQGLRKIKFSAASEPCGYVGVGRYGRLVRVRARVLNHVSNKRRWIRRRGLVGWDGGTGMDATVHSVCE